MDVILFGATGMVGQGALRECLADPEVGRVLAIGRGGTGLSHEKLGEIARQDLFDFSDIERELAGYDACFYCLGASAAGLSEAEYSRINYEMPMAAAETLARLNSGMTFIYVSGAGTDSTERGRTMWARVKGRTENALMRLPLRAVMFRPAIIQPLDGIRSKTRAYRIFYSLSTPVLPLLRRMFPGFVTTTRQLGRAMIRVAKEGSPKPVLESSDINAL